MTYIREGVYPSPRVFYRPPKGPGSEVVSQRNVLIATVLQLLAPTPTGSPLRLFEDQLVRKICGVCASCCANNEAENLCGRGGGGGGGGGGGDVCSLVTDSAHPRNQALLEAVLGSYSSCHPFERKGREPFTHAQSKFLRPRPHVLYVYVRKRIFFYAFRPSVHT